MTTSVQVPTLVDDLPNLNVWLRRFRSAAAHYAVIAVGLLDQGHFPLEQRAVVTLGSFLLAVVDHWKGTREP